MLKVRFKIWDTPGNRTMAPILNSFTQNSQFTVAVYSLIVFFIQFSKKNKEKLINFFRVKNHSSTQEI